MNDFALYTYFRSSASFRVRIAMKLKNLSYDYHAVHLLKEGGEQFKNSYDKLNPSQEVPTLVHKGKAIAQSMAIIDYLDALHPTPKLFPTDPYARALVIQACEIINSGTQPFVNTRIVKILTGAMGLREELKNKWVKDALEHGSRALEAFIAPHATAFALGSEVSAADCFILPHLISSDRFGGLYADCPTLCRLKENYLKSEAFALSMPDKQPDAQT